MSDEATNGNGANGGAPESQEVIYDREGNAHDANAVRESVDLAEAKAYLLANPHDAAAKARYRDAVNFKHFGGDIPKHAALPREDVNEPYNQVQPGTGTSHSAEARDTMRGAYDIAERPSDYKVLPSTPHWQMAQESGDIDALQRLAHALYLPKAAGSTLISVVLGAANPDGTVDEVTDDDWPSLRDRNIRAFGGEREYMENTALAQHYISALPQETRQAFTDLIGGTVVEHDANLIRVLANAARARGFRLQE